MAEKTPISISFSPIAANDATTLILGSMPGIISLEQQQYYAHPRNAFWPIMATLYKVETDWDYIQRCDCLMENKIAVWDVLQSCQRQGSLDQHIEANSMIANNFNLFLQQHPHVNRIFFNGGKAEQVFKRHVQPTLDENTNALSFQRLPSTSPAHAAMTFKQKLHIWQANILTD